jgi:ABC-type amino acid transport substrate-binding protein
MCFLMTGCAQESVGSGTLKVGVRTDIVNFGYYNSNTEQYYGLEIDIASELAKRMGYANVEFVPVSASDREEILEEGEVDCLLACYAVNSERKEKFDFSRSYYTDHAAVLVENSSLITEQKNLKDKTIGVLTGASTTKQAAAWLYENHITSGYDKDNFDVNTYDAGVQFKEYDSYDAMEVALETGEVDAICAHGCILQQYLSDDRSMLAFDDIEQDYCVATNQDSSLTDSVDQALGTMYEDETMEALYKQWK